ncbi:MAG: aminoacyl-tRNA hydrolase [Chloroflexaceae bacterium]|nr:aminoacyl-tRNA hydrolase [Chloroflexaceae bacterium]
MTQAQETKVILPQLIVGLGNPEPKYDKTRHNIGFEVVDALANAWQLPWQQHKRFQGWLLEKSGPHGKRYLLKPSTYMNNSGQAVRAVTDWYKIAPQSVLVIYDEMDLPVGRLRLRLSGSAGGHNGIKSIIAHLGTQDFPRLRLGIGKAPADKPTISHVLGKFAPQEAQTIALVLDLAIAAVEVSFKEGVEKAMNLYNTRSAEE